MKLLFSLLIAFNCIFGTVAIIFMLACIYQHWLKSYSGSYDVETAGSFQWYGMPTILSDVGMQTVHYVDAMTEIPCFTKVSILSTIST